MKRKPLPTGEEPPKGYESVMHLATIDDSIRVHGLILSQISRSERYEVDALRAKAFAKVREYIGLASDPPDFESEKGVIAERSDSDKLLFRAHLNKQLVGYAFVVTGWPHQTSWLIQHIVIDPDFRLKGIGSALLEKIEDYAASSEIDAKSIYAIPIQKSGIDFWRDHGYTKASQEHFLQHSLLDRELIIYSKEV
jgi:GNAT superfamily N-acetyltransferase